MKEATKLITCRRHMLWDYNRACNHLFENTIVAVIPIPDGCSLIWHPKNRVLARRREWICRSFQTLGWRCCSNTFSSCYGSLWNESLCFHCLASCFLFRPLGPFQHLLLHIIWFVRVLYLSAEIKWCLSKHTKENRHKQRKNFQEFSESTFVRIKRYMSCLNVINNIGLLDSYGPNSQLFHSIKWEVINPKIKLLESQIKALHTLCTTL